MRIIGDYHTHTIYSHGTGTIRDNVEAALNKGLKEVAICDHGLKHYLYGIKKKDISKMREEIERLKEEYEDRGIKILLGVEANIIGFDGTIDVDEKLLKEIDILLLGYHYGVTPNSIIDGLGMYILNPISKGLPLGRKSSLELNTKAFIKAINKYPVDLITHPGSKVKLDIKELAREAYKRGTALEINSSHSQLSVDNIKIALEEKVEFMINSDAHKPEDVGNVEEGIKRAIEAEIPLQRIRNILRN